MTSLLRSPVATSDGEIHADWLELFALASPRKVGSAEDFIGLLRASGTTDALLSLPESDDLEIGDLVDRGSERAQSLAETALSLVEERSNSVKAFARYPFTPAGRSVQARQGAARSTYTFLLLLSSFGHLAGPGDLKGAQLFERVAAIAAANYLGGPNSQALTYRLGAPRTDTPTSFGDAVDDLCRRLEEGGGAKRTQGTFSDQKDAKLDLIVWLPMPDGRSGKIIGFGQCATGNDWTEKLSELQSEAWCRSWLLEQPPVTPVRMFFVPHRVGRNEWAVRANHAGVLFDRCRIAAYASKLPADLRHDIWRWNTQVLTDKVGL